MTYICTIDMEWLTAVWVHHIVLIWKICYDAVFSCLYGCVNGFHEHVICPNKLFSKLTPSYGVCSVGKAKNEANPTLPAQVRIGRSTAAVQSRERKIKVNSSFTRGGTCHLGEDYHILTPSESGK